MKEIIGYYTDDRNLPIAYMKKNSLIVFSNNKELVHYKKLGGIQELHAILSNITYYTKIQKGGGGFFGESQGRCGWGDSPSCCFSSCAPLWKTNVWPFDFSM